MTDVVNISIINPLIPGHNAGGFIKIVIEIAYFLPALCHGGVCQEVIASAFGSKPFLCNGNPIFVKTVTLAFAGSPAVAEHDPCTGRTVISPASFFEPAGSTASVGIAVIVIALVLDTAIHQPSLRIVEIIMLAKLYPASSGGGGGFYLGFGSLYIGSCLCGGSACKAKKENRQADQKPFPKSLCLYRS